MTDTAPPKKRKSRISPVQRTLAELRKQGFTAAVVERWNPHAKIRQDLFGLIDVVAVLNQPTTYTPHVWGIQVCGGNGDLAAHFAKAEASPHFAAVRSSFVFQVWTWRKLGARGKRKLWTHTVWQRFEKGWIEVAAEP